MTASPSVTDWLTGWCVIVGAIGGKPIESVAWLLTASGLFPFETTTSNRAPSSEISDEEKAQIKKDRDAVEI